MRSWRAIVDMTEYIEKWGVVVVPRLADFRRGGHPAFIYEGSVDVRSLLRRPLQHRTFPSIDLLNGKIYWPRKGSCPYTLLHEFTHLMIDSRTVHVDEEEEMLAFEHLSVSYLEGLGRAVSVEGWRYWSRETNDTSIPLLKSSEQWRGYVVHLGLFTVDGQPTFKRWQTAESNRHKAKHLAANQIGLAHPGFCKRFKDIQL